jgi:3-oxoacyl-[acyl-carrier protein] reductase
MQLEGKNAIVTGGNRGIGRAIVLALADKGANIAFCFQKQERQAQEVLGELEKRNVQSFNVRTDVTDFEQVMGLVELTKERFGSIDIVVNNAGRSGEHRLVEDIGVEEWKHIIDVNLTGVFNCCKAAASELKRNRGKIVNIASIAGKTGGTIGCHYGASKAGVIGLTFALATEFAPYVTVNAVAPGPVDTELISSETKQVLSKKTPFGRIAKPEEIAHTVIFLLENDYVSGEVVDVNAARYMD